MHNSKADNLDQEAPDEVVTITNDGPFSALKYRNFRLFFIGQLISVIGTWMQVVAQQWLVYSLTHSAAWLGIVTGAGAIPYVILSLHGGNAADRYPRRTVLVITQTVSMLLAFVLALLNTNWITPIQPWHIALLAALSGVVNAYNMPAQQAFITDMIEERTALSSAISLNSFQFNIARFMGPVLAGWTLAHYGPVLCFTINGFSFLAVILSLLLMHIPEFLPSGTGMRNILGGFIYLRSHYRPLRVVLLVAFASLGAWSVSTLYPVYAYKYAASTVLLLSVKKINSESAVILGKMLAANGIGAALGGLITASVVNRMSRRTLFYGAAFAFGLSLLFFAISSHPIYAYIFLAINGLFMVAFAISANITVQEEAPDSLRGRVMAVYSLVFGGLMPLGGLEIGLLAHRIGAVKAILFNVSCFLLSVIVIFIWNITERNQARLPTLPDSVS